MSRIGRSKSKQPLVHRSKLFGGVKTAAEVHAESIKGGCTAPGCKHLPVIQIRCLMLLSDFTKQAPQFAAALAASNPDGPYVPTIPTTFGPMVRFSTVNACRAHQSEAEKQAAKAPSWVLVEIDRGPGSDKPVVQVARSVEA